MKKRLFSVILATALVASIFAGCGKTDDSFVAPTEAATIATTEAAVVTLETYLADDAQRQEIETAFQLKEAVEGLEDTYTGVSLAAESNTLFIDYFFTEAVCPAESEEAYMTALQTSVSEIGASTFSSILDATEQLTGIRPEAVGFRYFAASGNELCRISFTAAEIEAASN